MNRQLLETIIEKKHVESKRLLDEEIFSIVHDRLEEMKQHTQAKLSEGTLSDMAMINEARWNKKRLNPRGNQSGQSKMSDQRAEELRNEAKERKARRDAKRKAKSQEKNPVRSSEATERAKQKLRSLNDVRKDAKQSSVRKKEEFKTYPRANNLKDAISTLQSHANELILDNKGKKHSDHHSQEILNHAVHTAALAHQEFQGEGKRRALNHLGVRVGQAISRHSKFKTDGPEGFYDALDVAKHINVHQEPAVIEALENLVNGQEEPQKILNRLKGIKEESKPKSRKNIFRKIFEENDRPATEDEVKAAAKALRDHAASRPGKKPDEKHEKLENNLRKLMKSQIVPRDPTKDHPDYYDPKNRLDEEDKGDAEHNLIKKDGKLYVKDKNGNLHPYDSKKAG